MTRKKMEKKKDQERRGKRKIREKDKTQNIKDDETVDRA